MERAVMDLASRPQSASVTTMTEYVLPQHSNAFGGVFGGQIMGWVDLCAAMCAQRHSGRLAVTAFVGNLRFERPVRVGEGNRSGRHGRRQPHRSHLAVRPRSDGLRRDR
jgi:acyl-coenzyme A thioesterase PaaI-like protein